MSPKMSRLHLGQNDYPAHCPTQCRWWQHEMIGFSPGIVLFARLAIKALHRNTKRLLSELEALYGLSLRQWKSVVCRLLRVDEFMQKQKQLKRWANFQQLRQKLLTQNEHFSVGRWTSFVGRFLARCEILNWLTRSPRWSYARENAILWEKVD